MDSVLDSDITEIGKRVADIGDWEDSVVLITGCGGFLGFYFLTFFCRFGSVFGVKRVIALDRFLFGKPHWLSQLETKYSGLLETHSFDVGKDHLKNISGASQARYVIHAASIASPSYYRKFPLETVDANVWGLRSLLEFYSDSTVLKGFLFFSSSEIYGDPSALDIPTVEEFKGNVSCVGPRACYDEAKRFGETLCWIYGYKFGLPIVTARPFNNYGPGMRLSDKRLPADLALKVIKNEDIELFSDGNPTRTFCYVADAIEGYLRCLTHGQYDVFNIGNERPELSIREFAELAARVGHSVFGFSGKIVFKVNSDLEYLENNPNRRCPDLTKARTILNYRPSVEPEEGMERYFLFLRDGWSEWM